MSKIVITKKNATENKCKILVVNVPNEMDFDMIQLVFESTRILGQGSFDIVNHEEIFNSSENRNVRDIMLEYSNESAAEKVLKLGKVTVKDKHFIVQKFEEKNEIIVEEIIVEEEKMIEDSDQESIEEIDPPVLFPIRFDRNPISNKSDSNAELHHRQTEKSEPILTKANRKLFHEIENSHEFPFYLYEYCPSTYDSLKHELVQKFQFRIFKLVKNFIIESRFDKTGTQEEGQEVINNVLAYLHEFNQKNFAQFEINENLDNKYFWSFLKKAITPTYIDRQELALIIKDESEVKDRFFRIDGTCEVIEKEKVDLLNKIKEFHEKLEQHEKIGPNKEGFFSQSASKCWVQ